MKKIILSLIVSFTVFLGLQTTASYTLNSYDNNFINVLQTKINREIQTKWELQRQKFINILTLLSSSQRIAERPKAIFEELITRLSVTKPTVTLTTNTTTTTEIEAKPIVTDNLTTIRQEILKLVNQERAKAWLWALTLNDKLNKSSQLHAEDMAAKDYFNHTSKDGRTPSERVLTQDYDYHYVWENIAWNQRTAQEVMDDRMNSPWHKANILWANFKEIGIWLSDRYRVQNFWAQF